MKSKYNNLKKLFEKYYKIILIGIFITIILSYLIFIKKENFNNWEQKIDGVVYINLENRPDRKEFIEKELCKMKIDKKKINKVAGIYIPNNGHKGCIQSHLIALRIAKMNKWNNIFILEDDAELATNIEDFEKHINEVMLYLKDKEWDVIMLSIANENYEDTDNENIKRILGGTLGTSYIVNKHYYEDLIMLFEDCNNKMVHTKWGNDDGHEPNALDQKWVELQSKDKWYCYKEPLIKQRKIWSTTNNRGKQ